MFYKDIMLLQSSIRATLTSIMEKRGLSVGSASQLIGISPITLSSFLIKEKDIRFVQFCKIKTFCESIH